MTYKLTYFDLILSCCVADRWIQLRIRQPSILDQRFHSKTASRSLGISDCWCSLFRHPVHAVVRILDGLLGDERRSCISAYFQFKRYTVVWFCHLLSSSTIKLKSTGIHFLYYRYVSWSIPQGDYGYPSPGPVNAHTHSLTSWYPKALAWTLGRGIK